MSTNDSPDAKEAGPRETGIHPAAPHSQTARHGKMARLPLAVRTELNERLRNGEKGAGLIVWLNSLPEVQQVLRDHFAGVKLTKENLSRWRHGGYQDWLAEAQNQEAIAGVAAQGAALQGVTMESLSQNMGLVIAARLAAELRRSELLKDGEARFKTLRDILWGFIFLRRSETEAEKLKIEKYKKAGFRLSPAEMETEFWLWANVPENKEMLKTRLFLTKEEKQACVDYILGDNSQYWAATEEDIIQRGGTVSDELRERMAKAKAAAPPPPKGIYPERPSPQSVPINPHEERE